MRATVHQGPQGGTEYRLWDDERGTFRVVGKYKARPHMSAEELAKAEAMEAARKASRQAKADSASAWRNILRGG